MVRKNRDSKFIIYQVLYIFVVTVIVIKGADLNLDEVISKNQAVSMTVKDSLVTLIDSLSAQGAKFKIQVNPVKEENSALKEKLVSLNQRIQHLALRIKEEPKPQPVITPVVNKPEKKEQTILQSPISLAQTFIQYTWNIAKNTGNVPVGIYDPKNMGKPIVVIPPGQAKKFNLMSQTEVIAKYGDQEQKLKVLPNKIPKVLIQKVTTLMNGSNIYVQELQRITAFTVTIVDDRPGQLKVNYNGPISVTGPFKDNDNNPVYNVSLNLAPNQDKFNKWVDEYGYKTETNGIYKANFFFTVRDTISKAHVEVGDSFYFTDYSR